MFFGSGGGVLGVGLPGSWVDAFPASEGLDAAGDSVRVCVRQRAKQDRVSHAQNRGIGTDREHHGQNRDKRKSRRVSETTPGKDQIVPERR